jgi:hypothetical protein
MTQRQRPPEQPQGWREALVAEIDAALKGHVPPAKRISFAERACDRASELHNLTAPLWCEDYERARDRLEQAAGAIARALELLYGEDKAGGDHWSLPGIFLRRALTQRGVEVVARRGRVGLERIARKELGAQMQASITPRGATVAAWSWCELLDELARDLAGARKLAHGRRRPSPSDEIRYQIRGLAADFEKITGEDASGTRGGLFDLCAQATARAAGYAGVRRPDLVAALRS